MNKFATTVLLFLFPALALADVNTLTFAPPASDYSVVFLSNLFGVVDGVLHGSGSQILGNIFGVFNAAVLALGGIVIMYTLIVATMNTAHEGQMLGQKWSSIWIPLRSTMGVALLIPKASGYCMMQIFVMWIVVQGIGAADVVWSSALSYLNRGGVIIQAQSNPGIALTKSADSGVAQGAMTILSGQVCMYGLQKQLERQRQIYLDLASQNSSGPCSGTPSSVMSGFCTTAVPDFLGTVSPVTIQNNNKNAANFSVPMPNFDADSPFQFLNGVCGTIKWNAMSALNQSVTGTAETGSNVIVGGTNVPIVPGASITIGGIKNITPSELETAQLSRVIAIQQMYMDLSSVAQVMVNNDPSLSTLNNNSESIQSYSLVANQQFGVPYTSQRTICSSYGLTCTIWGPLPTPPKTNTGVLFNGTEFVGAINDYNGIMMPTINLLREANSSLTANASHKFIINANSQGWMMAGSYFFDLVLLNGNAVTNADQYDTNTGLDQSTFESKAILAPFGDKGSCSGPLTQLCQWFSGASSMVIQIQSLIDGSVLTTSASSQPVAGDAVAKPDLTPNPKRQMVGDLGSSTVYGFINNSVMLQLPGQPGLKPLEFDGLVSFTVDPETYKLPKATFDCGFHFLFCFGRVLGDVFYNDIFRGLYNFFLSMFGKIINQVIMAFLMIPIQGMADIFRLGMTTLTAPGVNPIVAMANMGVMYINFSANLWMMLLNISITTALIPIFGIFIFALISLAMPLLMAWIGIMVGIGFTTAYYIPMLPYMIFTFGTLGWLMAVIEAMVAAPIVALGITHPEGNDAFGKGEHAIMILMNVFLRPSMMIIGFISAISLSYVGVWILNAGYDHAVSFIQRATPSDLSISTAAAQFGGQMGLTNETTMNGSGTGQYVEWAGIYAFFFSVLIYVSMYLIIVQKSFTLISYLPDKVLRWIGGNPESIGSESGQWGEEMKQGVKDAGKETSQAQGQMDKQMGAYGQKGVGKVQSGIKSAFSGGGTSSLNNNPSSTPSSGDGADEGGGGAGGGGGGGMKPE